MEHMNDQVVNPAISFLGEKHQFPPMGQKTTVFFSESKPFLHIRKQQKC